MNANKVVWEVKINRLNENDFSKTSDIVVDDIIILSEVVLEGSYKSLKYKGDRKIFAKILKENYGEEKQ
jgi:hypothetical protein